MKVGFGAYAVGVLFMDSLLSIISIIPWILRQPVSCCVTVNVGNAKARITPRYHLHLSRHVIN